MTVLAPSFSVSIGAVNSSTAEPIAGPIALLVERDMDIPADGCRLQLKERADIALGDEVEVKLGHDGEEETVFTGMAIALCPSLVGVELRAIGKLDRLLNLRAATLFEEQSAGAIARDLIDRAGLTAGTVDEGPELPRYTVDRQRSAYFHLRELADRLGYELYGDRQGQVNFRALGAAANLDSGMEGVALPGLAEGGETYQFGQQLLAAKARQQATTWGTIAVGGESPMSSQGDTTVHWLSAEEGDAQGESGGEEPALLILDAAARTQDLARRFAEGQLVRANRRDREISFRVLGQPQVELGDLLGLEGNGDDLLNQSGYVRALRHRFGADVGFVTDIRIAVEGNA